MIFGIDWDQVASIVSYSALLGLGYAFTQSLKSTRKLQKEKEEILNWKKMYTLHLQNLTKLKDEEIEGKCMAYVEIDRSKSTITPTTIIRRIQSYPNSILADYQQFKLFSKQCGNSFDYNFNGEKVKVNINECNIYGGLLDRKAEPILLQPQSNPTHYDLTYTLKAAMSLSLVGSIAYNLQAKQFVIEPRFIFPYTSMAQVYKWLDNHYNLQLDNLRVGKILLGICIGILSPFVYMRIKSDCKKISDYINMKFNIGRKDKLKYVQTRPNDRLKCTCSKTMNIIGNCGHLSMCSQCFQKDKHCKICNNLIANETIIYI